MTNEQLLQLGVLVVFIGLIIVISSFLFTAHEKGRSSFKFSVVGFLGFVPFGFGNDKRLLIFTALLTVVVVAAAIILFSRSLKP